MTIIPINPSSYIKNHAPAVEPRKDISKWFKEEKLELNFGESVGRPSMNILLHKEYLTRFLENGWTVDAVISSGEDGEWEQVTTQTSDTETSRAEIASENSTTQTNDNANETGDATSRTEKHDDSYSNTTSHQDGYNNSYTHGKPHEETDSNSRYDETRIEDTKNDSTTRSDSNSTQASNSTENQNSASGAGSSSFNSSSNRGENNKSHSDGETHNTFISRPEVHRIEHSDYKKDTILDSHTDVEYGSDGDSDSESHQTQTDFTQTHNQTESTKEGATRTLSNNDASESGLTSAKSETKSGGGAYWYAYQRIRLKRRRMQPELVLQDMVNSFTNEYNSGRKIDNERYNELVSLYSVVINNNEKEINSFLVGADNLTGLFNQIYDSTCNSLVAAHNLTTDMSKYFEEDAITDINRQFDALRSNKMAEMISGGMFNNTVWASVEAGIERQRAAAILKARAEAKKTVIDTYAQIANIKGSVYMGLLSARQSIADAKDKRAITATELRNTVVKWMLDYVGSREEVYPSLEEVSAIAQNLGFSIGAAGNVL